MAAVTELIRKEADGSLSFGDYSLDAKAKLELNDNGDVYKVKTCKEITKLEKNDMFVYESVPGTAVTNFVAAEGKVTFTVEGNEDAQVTLELEEDTEYEIFVDENSVGTMTTNLGGKLSVSVELAGVEAAAIEIEKR